MYKTLENIIRQVGQGKIVSEKDNRTLESKIRAMSEQRAALEKDQGDQIPAGSYTTREFEVSPDAQKLFLQHIPKTADPNAVEQMAIYHDKLFAVVKHAVAKESSSKKDIETANDHIRKIYDLADKIGIAQKVNYFGDMMKVLKDLEKPDHPNNEVNPEDVDSEREKVFTSKPATATPEIRDFDVDNTQRFINRTTKAERKLKIIDDEYHALGEAIDTSKQYSPDQLTGLVGKMESDPTTTTQLAVVIGNAMVRASQANDTKGLSLMLAALQLLEMSDGNDVLLSVARRLLATALSTKSKKGK
jgi:hypothetical protein